MLAHKARAVPVEQASELSGRVSHEWSLQVGDDQTQEGRHRRQARVFAKLIKNIEVVARQGGGDPPATPRFSMLSKGPQIVSALGQHRACGQAWIGRRRWRS